MEYIALAMLECICVLCCALPQGKAPEMFKTSEILYEIYFSSIKFIDNDPTKLSVLLDVNRK